VENRAEVLSLARVSTPTGVVDERPCVHCGRPVPQRGGAGRPFRYCRDNDGACLRAARNSRMRERSSPGLAGQVARTWELVERLELTAGTLADALHAELSPAGVERQTAAVRAEAAVQIAAAHTERDEARQEAQAAGVEAAARREETAAAALRGAELEQALTRAEAVAQQATAERAEAVAGREAANTRAARAEGLREQAEQERDRLTDELAGVRRAHEVQLRELTADRDGLRERVAELTRELDSSRVRADEAAQERDLLAGELAQARELTGTLQRDADRYRWQAQTVQAELDRARTEVERGNSTRTGLVDQLSALRGELVAARAEQRATARHAEQLTAQVNVLTTALTQPRQPEPDNSLASQK